MWRDALCADLVIVSVIGGMPTSINLVGGSHEVCQATLTARYRFG